MYKHILKRYTRKQLRKLLIKLQEQDPKTTIKLNLFDTGIIIDSKKVRKSIIQYLIDILR